MLSFNLELLIPVIAGACGVPYTTPSVPTPGEEPVKCQLLLIIQLLRMEGAQLLLVKLYFAVIWRPWVTAMRSLMHVLLMQLDFVPARNPVNVIVTE